MWTQCSILGFVVSDITRRIFFLVISKVCALSCLSKFQRDTTSLVKGTAIETLRTKYKRTTLYSGPPNLADEGWKKQEVIAVFDVIAHLATIKVGTPSLLDDENDDKNPVKYVSKSTKLGREGKALPQKSQKRIDPVAKNPEDPLVKQGEIYPPSRKTPEESSAEIMAILANLSKSMQKVLRTVDCARGEMK